MPHALRNTLPLVALALLVSAPAVAGEPAAITPPSLTRYVPPELPEGVPLKDLDVVVVLTIGTDGSVTDAELRTAGGEPYDAAALEAARKLQFQPARQGDTPIAVRVPFTFEYRIPRRRGRMLPEPRGRRDKEAAPGYLYVGEVVEKGTRTPLGGVAVIATDPRTKKEYQAVTDDRGRFRLEGLPPGKLQLQVVTPQYKQQTTSVRGAPLPARGAPPPEPANTWYLAPKSFSKYRTVVKQDKRPPAASEIKLTEEELTQVPGTFGDPTRVVATLPGVARSPFGLGYYVVRGASFENTGFFIDGHPAIFLYHLGGGPGVIHPELVGALNFYPGGYPASYGRFAGGAIAVETKDPPDDRWHLELEFDIFKASALVSVPFDDKKGQVTFSLRRSYYEALLPLIQPGVNLSYLDYQARIRYNPSDAVRWRFMALGAEDGFSAENFDSGNNNPNNDQSLELGFHRLLTALEVDFSKTVTWVNSVAWEYDHTGGRRIAEGEDDLKAEVTGWFIQHRSFVKLRPVDNLRIEAGLDYLYLTAAADLNIPSVPPLGDPRPPLFDPLTVALTLSGPQWSIAPYVMADWEIVPGLRVLPGFRLPIELYSDRTWVRPDPKLAVRWKFLPEWTLKGSIAMAHQPPTVIQTVEPFGSPDIPPVEGFQSSLGVEVIPTEGWEISVEGFYNEYGGIARPVSAEVGDDGSLGATDWKADVRGRAFGVELLIRKQMGDGVWGWLSYTLSRAERLTPPGDWEAFNVDQTHVLNLAWSFDLGDEWTLGARFQLTSGNPYYPVVGSRYDADRDRYQPIYAKERDRLPLYHRLDLRLDKRFRFDTWILSVFLDIQNVYNVGNPEAPRYSYDYRIRSDGLSIPILPTLGLKASF